VFKGKILLLKFSEAFKEVAMFFERKDVDVLLQKFHSVGCYALAL